MALFGAVVHARPEPTSNKTKSTRSIGELRCRSRFMENSPKVDEHTEQFLKEKSVNQIGLQEMFYVCLPTLDKVNVVFVYCMVFWARSRRLADFRQTNDFPPAIAKSVD